MIKPIHDAGSALPGPPPDLGTCRHGLLQVSCAVLLERDEPPDHQFGSRQTAPTAEQIKNRIATFEDWFAPQPGAYQLKALWEHEGVSPVLSPFSWLDPLSRHYSYDMPVYRGYADANPGNKIPPLFNGAKDPSYECRPRPFARIPVQGPHRLGDEKPDGWAIQELDHNDFLVMGTGDRSAPEHLAEAQRFLVFLFALRRATIFTASMRERIYNIWLPPGVLVPSDPGAGLGQIAVFPYAGLTRRPSSQAWRFVFTFSLVIAPTASDDGGTNRLMTDAELGTLVGSFDGPSMTPIRREPDIGTYRVLGDAWRHYVSALLRQSPPSALDPRWPEPGGTLRNWAELLFFAVARRQLAAAPAGGKRPARGSKYPRGYLDDKYLADEVLRSIRTTSCWSVLLDAPPHLQPASPADPPPADTASWTPKAGLDSLMNCFDHLAIGNSRWFRPSDEDRVDRGRVGELTWMSWALPIRRCIVTFYFSRAEAFPLRSRLNLFAVFGHMIAGLMTTREILVRLGHDVELHREPQVAAEFRRKYAIELEEMFDLDIAWAFYRKMYQRLRNLRGLDEMYRSVRERTDVLSQLDTTLDEIRTEKRRTRLSIAAAILAVPIIGLAAWQLPPYLGPALFATVLVIVAVTWGGWGQWGGWKTRRKLR